MNEKQKKVISIGISTIMIIGSIVLFVLGVIGVVNKETQGAIMLAISAILSPSTTLGILIKYLMNKWHLKAQKKQTHQIINEKLVENGVLKQNESDLGDLGANIPNTRKTLLKSPENWIVVYNNKKLVIDFTKATIQDKADFHRQATKCFGLISEEIRKNGI